MPSAFPPSAPGLPPAAAPGGGVRTAPRWRDIEWVEFEGPLEPPPGPAMPAPLRPLPPAANSNEPLPRAPLSRPRIVEAPSPAPEPPSVFDLPHAKPRVEGPSRTPRYGRDIAPLPVHLTAPAPPPQRAPAASARVRRPGGAALSRRVGLGGSVMPASGRGGRGLGIAAVAALVAVGAVLLFAGGALLVDRSGIAERRIGSEPARAAATPAIRQAGAMTAADPAAASGAPPVAVAPVQPDRVGQLLARAKAGETAAQYDLAMAYATGDGVARDYVSAASWFREAAINGNIAAQYNLGVLYERGLGLPENMNEALIWYHNAAAHRYAPAEYNLAASYADGRGQPRDTVSARRWYRRAAEQGLVSAMVNLAILLEQEVPGGSAPVEAYAWYRAAAAHSDAASGRHAADLLQRFSPDDKRRADTEAAAVAASIQPPMVPAAVKPGG